ncbi:class II histocompatibility antigen, B-L beta chain-like isoform X4 [Numida meleagris]|uniref:class II histocompatibility antigen, B-L beta chain-like isoform X4 n=1 Tax=Numida meleagris TaxID=8996 RepID=UPI000B3E0328|nr:class II histocompatibility antigen, B-L beta chain-like isoform X4 [Numida meleagris]
MVYLCYSTVELSAFPSSTEGVRFLKTFTYNQQQYIHVDSNMGICVANTALSKLQAKHFNSQSSFLVDMFYWHNDNVWMPFLWCKRAQGEGLCAEVGILAPNQLVC